MSLNLETRDFCIRDILTLCIKILRIPRICLSIITFSSPQLDKEYCLIISSFSNYLIQILENNYFHHFHALDDSSLKMALVNIEDNDPW